ncbi:MAG: peptide deformylase [Gammaproteobacteria bacterium]|nr:peptide deformylase [Gammaproteobacteria bacterium]
MPRLLQLALLGHPVLRQSAAEVADPGSVEIRELVDDMLFTMTDANGVGIAAPQVHVDKRVVIVASRPNPRYPDAPQMEPTAMINPEIIWRSDETCEGWEGCLSIPGIRGLVPRYKAIRIAYTTFDGTRVEQHFTDFVARVFQHEFDHLEGVSFLDRVVSTRDLMTEKEWLKRNV